MKTYKGKILGDQVLVTAGGTSSVMNNNFELARFLLNDCIKEENFQNFQIKDFVDDVISKFNGNWEITCEDVMEWWKFKREIGCSIQKASLGHEPSNPDPKPLSLPRLISNPNYRLSF
jgi:hypothetical protein